MSVAPPHANRIMPPIRAIQGPCGATFSAITKSARIANPQQIHDPADEQQCHQDPAAAHTEQAMSGVTRKKVCRIAAALQTHMLKWRELVEPGEKENRR
jgi:hypothetical protein